MVNCPINIQAKSNGGAPAIVSDTEILSYFELNLRIFHATALLQARGVANGGRVALDFTSLSTTIVQLFAALRLGALVTVVDRRQPAAEIKRRFTRAKIELTLADSDLQNVRSDRDRNASFSAAELSGSVLIFSSGSTGSAKGVLLSTEALFSSARSVNQYFNVKPTDRWVLALPVSYVAGLAVLFRSIASGGTLVVAEDLVRDTTQFSGTLLSVVPAQLAQLLAHRSELCSLRAILVGGGRLEANLREQCHAAKLPIFLSYGMSEAASTIAISPVEDLSNLRFTMLSHINSRIVADNQSADHEEGEIEIKGPSLFSGYLENDGSFSVRERWFGTGDRGAQTDLGEIILSGRAGTAINSGGEKIYPVEIESIVRGQPDVSECVVLKVADPRWGERPFLLVESKVEPRAMRESLKKIFDLELPVFKHPDSIEVVLRIPRSDRGKVDLLELRHRFPNMISDSPNRDQIDAKPKTLR